MEKLTYKQAYDKIIQAYFKDEIKPMEPEFCFCGTLAGNGNWGGYGFGEQSNLYSLKEFDIMESALLNTMDSILGGNLVVNQSSPFYEDALFAGMSAALEVLKEIHRARGEDVDEVPMFTKRELLTP